MKIKYYFLIAALSLLSVSSLRAQTTAGTEFWLTFGSNGGAGHAFVDLQIRIVGGAQAASVTIHFTDLGASGDVTFTVAAGSVHNYPLDPAQKAAVYNTTMGISNRSVHITSSAAVTAYALNQSMYVTDATNILPTTALWIDYYQISYITPGNVDVYMIVATQDNTQVHHNGTLAAILNKGQVYYRTSPIDMTGAHITTNKPVAFFAANPLTYIPANSYNADNLFQQLAPVHTWGKNFFVPVSHLAKDRVRIVVSENGTNITQTGGELKYATGSQMTLTNLQAGQFVELEVNLNNNGCYIQSDKPIGICTYLTGAAYNGFGISDPAQAWLPAIEQTVASASMSPFIPDGNTALYAYYALIITPTATQNNTTVSVGGGAPTPLSGGTWHNHSSGYSFYSVPLTNNTASYLFANPNKLFIMSYGIGPGESYYYLAASAMRDLTGIFYANDILYQDLDNHLFCENEIEFRAEIDAMGVGIDSLKWYINGTEYLPAQNEEVWSYTFASGDYLITLEAYTDNNETLTFESALHIGAQITATPSPTAGGSITGDGCYQIGEQVTLTAIPAECFGFVNWTMASGTVISTDNLFTFTVIQDSTLIANFKRICDCSINLYTTDVSPDGFIMLEWEWNPPPPTETYGYTLFQWDEIVGWQSVSTNCDKTIQVLNVYPDNPLSNTLADWMHDPDIGFEKIWVTPVTITDFNNNPDGYLKNGSGQYQYDVVMFGSWDNNDGKDLTPVSADAVRAFLNSGRGVLFGHDTQHYNKNFALLADKINLHIDINDFSYFRGSEIIKVVNDGFLLKYPHHIPYNETLTIPCTHTSGQFAKGIVWMNFPDPQQGPCFHAPIQELEDGTNDFYLTTWNNAAMIQTGHTGGQSTPDERKVIANTLWYLSQFTTDTTSKVCSAFDLAAPDIPTVIRQTCNQIEITSEDNGTSYRFYIKAINMVSNSDTCTSNILDVINKTGLRGFYILEDESPTHDSDLSYLPLTLAMYNQPVIYDVNDMTKYIHVQAVDSVGNLSAIFTLDPPTYDIILSANPTVGGTACCNSTYFCNDTVKIEAFPYPCYGFEKWTINDTVLYDNPYEFVITENMHFVAHFFALNPDTLCCPATISDSEGHVYKVTKLAGLCWTSNLKATVYDDGITPIAWAKPYYSAFYPDSDAHVEIFGLLYTWYSAVGLPEGSTQTLSGLVQGICPKGWHIPSQEEWNRLNEFSAEELKSADYWFIPGTDRYGFDSRPAGWYNGATNRFEELYGFTGYWSILSDNNQAHYFSFTYYCNGIIEEVKYKQDGLSVRCVMDE